VKPEGVKSQLSSTKRRGGWKKVRTHRATQLNPSEAVFSATEKDHSPPPIIGPRTRAREAADWERPFATGESERKGEEERGKR